MAIPILETKRLILRPLPVNDAEAAFAWLGDERVTQYMPFDTYKSVKEIEQKLQSINVDSLQYNWGFVLRERNILIGQGNIYFKDEVRGANTWKTVMTLFKFYDQHLITIR